MFDITSLWNTRHIYLIVNCSTQKTVHSHCCLLHNKMN
jgi:hypothetical protein